MMSSMNASVNTIRHKKKGKRIQKPVETRQNFTIEETRDEPRPIRGVCADKHRKPKGIIISMPGGPNHKPPSEMLNELTRKQDSLMYRKTKRQKISGITKDTLSQKPEKNYASRETKLRHGREDKKALGQDFTTTASTDTELPAPEINSFLIEAGDSPTKLERKAFKWIRSELMCTLYSDSIVPVVPYYNPIRMSHQTPQALRIFYSSKVKSTSPSEKNHESKRRKKQMKRHGKVQNTKQVEKLNQIKKHGKVKNSKQTLQKNNEIMYERLYSYGLLSILKTTGFHPNRDMKVRPFSKKLNVIVDLLEKEVKRHLPANSKYHTNNLNFNSLEVKIYHGKNVYHGGDGRPLIGDHGKRIRDDCNKTVNLHNDLSFNDQGKQSSKDTARGDHPIVTLTIGSPRRLTFVHQWKTDKKWRKGKNEKFQLGQGSMFVLLPDDEIHQAVGAKLHKTRHRARFGGKGISVALVFRSVRTSSLFHRENHTWNWQDDDLHRKPVQRYLDKNSQRHNVSKISTGGTGGREVKAIRSNVDNFLDEIEKKRFDKSARRK